MRRPGLNSGRTPKVKTNSMTYFAYTLHMKVLKLRRNVKVRTKNREPFEAAVTWKISYIRNMRRTQWKFRPLSFPVDRVQFASGILCISRVFVLVMLMIKSISGGRSTKVILCFGTVSWFLVPLHFCHCTDRSVHKKCKKDQLQLGDYPHYNVDFLWPLRTPYNFKGLYLQFVVCHSL